MTTHSEAGAVRAGVWESWEERRLEGRATETSEVAGTLESEGQCLLRGHPQKKTSSPVL